MDKDNNKIVNDEIHLNFYTVTGMLGVLTCAATTMLCGIVFAKPGFYFTKSQFGGMYYDDMISFFEGFIFNETATSKLNIYCLVAAIISAIATLFTVIVVAKAANPKNKPATLLGVLAFVLSLATMVIHLITRNYAMEKIDEYISSVADSTDKLFTVTDGVFIAVIVNVIIMLLMLIGMISAFGKWKSEQ